MNAGSGDSSRRVVRVRKCGLLPGKYMGMAAESVNEVMSERIKESSGTNHCM